MKRSDYFACPGCSRLFKGNDPLEQSMFDAHDCDDEETELPWPYEDDPDIEWE
jgi:hypothetical protein